MNFLPLIRGDNCNLKHFKKCDGTVVSTNQKWYKMNINKQRMKKFR